MNFIRVRAFAAIFFALGVSTHAEQVSVDFQSPIRPLTHAGSGFLHSFTTTTPPDNLVVPLRPQLFRSYPEFDDSGAFPTYDRVAAMGGKTQLVVSDAYGYDAPWPGDDDNWNTWEDLCRELVNHAMLEGKTIQYDIWNEPDIDFFWGRSKQQWLEMWQHGVQTIRALDPGATIVGPSPSSYNNSFLSMHEFLTFARDNNVLPNVISWHQFTGNFTAEVADLRAVMAAEEININRISLNEIVDSLDTSKPGVMPQFFEQIERNGIESAARACWVESSGVDSCFNGSLDGLLTSDTKQPRSTWWTYERYGKMAGTSVSTVASPTLDAVASRSADAAYVLLGRFDVPDNGNAAELFLDNLDDIASLIQNGQIHVLAERIVDTGLAASTGPLTVINANVNVTNGQVLVSLPNFNTYDAYFVTLTAPLPGDYNGDAKVDAADYATWRKTIGTPTAYNLWRTHFDQSAANGASYANLSVAEPATIVVLLIGMLAGSCRVPLLARSTVLR